MFLRSLEIKNYRSLEHVELEKLGNFNVLIGRNNSGKSSVFNALALLSDSMRGVQVDWDKVLTARDVNRSLEFRLVFEPHSKDRDQLISILASSLSDQRKEEILKSPFFRQVEFFFVGAEKEDGIWLNETRLRVENNQWAVIQKLGSQKSNDRRLGEIINLQQAAEKINGMLGAVLTNIETVSWKTGIGFTQSTLSRSISNLDPATAWILKIPWHYLSKAFFFSPFRHSKESFDVQGRTQLSQDGADLAQVLNAIHNKNRQQFYNIEKFLHTALPDIGMLHTPIQSNTNITEVAISADNLEVRLHEMGGGVEQLLMIATVLFTTGDESTLFLEEPESHLHAGAQRFLIGKLREGKRQVFITTHSPTFINAARDRSLYRVRLNENRTTISHYNDADSLSEVLEDIGSRNSDLLLSDAVLFVEGPGDQRVLEIWGEKLGLSLQEHNITIVPMGGGSDASRGTRVRSDVLEGISQKAPVPHLFILDRDERSQAEIGKLQVSLGGRICLLQRRELENYLLVPRALLAAMRSKHSNDGTLRERIDAYLAEDITKIIQKTVDSLFDLILMKRIRAEIPGIRGGLLPPNAVVRLSHKVHYKNFPRILRREIESLLAEHLDALKINELINNVKIDLEVAWADTSRRSWIAPGEEIVATVFQHFGSKYNKPNDTLRIAKEMREDEIPEEMIDLLRKIVALTR